MRDVIYSLPYSEYFYIFIIETKIEVMNTTKNSKENKIGKIHFFFIILLLISFFIYVEVKAQSKTWVAPKEADNVKNPLAGNTDILKYAKVIYTTYCGPCHGNGGKGDGIAAAGLAVKPADHTSDKVQAQTDGALFWMMTTGRSPMPSYKTTLPDNQRWELVNYIRSLAKNKK
jgi:mono/diheme cytochrome c family protein